MSESSSNFKPRKRGRRGGRHRGKGAKFDRTINAKATDRAAARIYGGEIPLPDGTVASIEGLNLDLDGDKSRPGLWERKRSFRAGEAE